MTPSLLSIARLLSLLLISPLLGLVPWFVIPWGWWAAAASSPGGWPAVLTPAAWSLFVVVSFPLVSRVSSFLPLVLRFDLSVCSGVRPASGAASSTTIITVVAVEISSAVGCEKNRAIEERVTKVSKLPRKDSYAFIIRYFSNYNLVFWNWIRNQNNRFLWLKAPKRHLRKWTFFFPPFSKGGAHDAAKKSGPYWQNVIFWWAISSSFRFRSLWYSNTVREIPTCIFASLHRVSLRSCHISRFKTLMKRWIED